VRFVSNKLCKALGHEKSTQTTTTSLEHSMRKNFWKSCKQLFESSVNTIPSFDMHKCINYFQNILRLSNKTRNFHRPSWVPSLPLPQSAFNDTPPKYKVVVRVINKSRAAASQCPLDQMPTLVMKKCPIIRTALHKLHTECWTQRDIPACWKDAMTVLKYKKGPTDDPANFRPITLQPVFYKIFAALYRNRIYQF